MQVTISVGGKWAAFQTAEQLEQRGQLHRLLTTYYGGKPGLLPVLRKDLEVISPKKVHLFLLPELLKKLRLYLPYQMRGPLLHAAYEQFDSWASSRLGECDVVLAWSGFALRTMRAAKRRGATTIVVRSSAHTLVQKRLIEEEFAQVGRSRKHELFYDPLVNNQLKEYAAADYILVPSQSVADTFLQSGVPQEKIVRVPHGIHTSHFHRVRKEDSRFRVLYVGVLSLEKGVHYLLEAVSRLRSEDGIGVDLWLVGKVLPEIKPFLHRYRGLFKAFGTVPNVDLPWYYSQSSVFISPSIQDGMPWVVVEAMACGVPVVCTPTGATEVVRDGVDGYVVPFSDPEALRQRLLDLYQRPEEVARLGSNAQQRAQEFSVDAYGEMLSGVLQEIVPRAKSITLKERGDSRSVFPSLRVQSHLGQKRLNVLMLSPKYFVGTRNSDIRTYPLLKGLERLQPVEMRMFDSNLVSLQANVSYAFASVLWHSGLPKRFDTISRIWHYLRRLVLVPEGVIERTQADVVYTLLLFPTKPLSVPIVLDFDFNPWGIPALRAEVDRLRYIPRWMVERSAVIMVRHEVSLEAFKERFPDQAHKGIVVPSPLPGCEAISEEQVMAKFASFSEPTVKILFVGDQARKKGLRELLQAYETLSQRHPLELTVVSAFADGAVKVLPEVRVLSNLPSGEVYSLMAEAHIFAMPTKRDSHGRVFWEAMAKGCALLAPCFTPHKELFGEFGATADPTSVADITQALEGLITNPQLCLERALHARRTFLQKYHYSVAAEAYYEAFRRAAEGRKRV